MFETIFTRQFKINQHYRAPLLQERLYYLKYWHKNGATKNTLCDFARYLLIIIDYLKIENKKFITASEIKKAAIKMSVTLNRSYAESHFIYVATHWMKMLNLLKQPILKTHAFEKQLSQYLNYLEQDKGFSKITIADRSSRLKNLFKSRYNDYISLEQLNTAAIDKIFTKKSTKGLARRTIQAYVSTINSFLRYAEKEGWCKKKLSKTVIAPRIYTNESLPSGPSWDNVKQLLNTTEGNKPKDIRDRAILLFLAIYGLRSHEVVRLHLNDFDFKNNLFIVKRAKNLKVQKFLLSKIVKEAILHYLKEVRPNPCKYQELFICLNAPYRPLDQTTLYPIVMDRWKLLNITNEKCGSHALRHSCATHLISRT